MTLPLSARHALLESARSFAATARPAALRHFRQPLEIEAKSDDSPVTRADRETETCLRAVIMAAFPDHGILGEEFGPYALDAEFVWSLDPIDGTKSFLSGHPLWGTLIGLLHRGRPILGVISMPALGEEISGGPGLGCCLNGIPVQPSPALRPKDARLILNELPGLLHAEPDRTVRLLGFGHFPRASADCYSYLQLAAGWVDAVVDYGLQPYDWQAVLPVVEASGHLMTDWHGAPLGYGSDGRILAARPELHAELLSLLA